MNYIRLIILFQCDNLNNNILFFFIFTLKKFCLRRAIGHPPPSSSPPPLGGKNKFLDPQSLAFTCNVCEALGSPYKHVASSG